MFVEGMRMAALEPPSRPALEIIPRATSEAAGCNEPSAVTALRFVGAASSSPVLLDIGNAESESRLNGT
jgi:hypothetical protein